MIDSIRFVGKVEANEMVRAYKLAWRHTWQMSARILFYCVLVASAAATTFFGIYAYRHGDQFEAWRFWGYGILLLVCLAMSELNLRRKVARSLRAGLFDEEGQAIVDGTGVSLTDGKTNLQVPWKKFQGFRGTNDMIVYYVSYPRSFLTFFRRLAATTGDWDRFLAVTSERLTRR
jgi:hypothetical protein